MRVFVTGASGWIGSAVVPELINHGHTVLGLARSDASAAKITAAGAEVLRGDITVLESLKEGAASCDGVIQLGFVHDFSDYVGSCAKDLAAIEAMASVMEGTNKPLVIAGGTLMAPLGELATEDTPPNLSVPGLSARGHTEVKTLALADKGIRSCAIRLPPTVHGTGDHGFIPMIIGIAKEKGVVAYVGEGSNRWPAVHVTDAAVVIRLALEKAEPGTRVHAVENDGYPFKQIAEAIGKKYGLPVESKTPEEAPAYFTWLAHFVAGDNPTSNALTKERLGWETTQIGLLEDIEKNY